MNFVSISDEKAYQLILSKLITVIFLKFVYRLKHQIKRIIQRTSRENRLTIMSLEKTSSTFTLDGKISNSCLTPVIDLFQLSYFCKEVYVKVVCTEMVFILWYHRHRILVYADDIILIIKTTIPIENIILSRFVKWIYLMSLIY